MKKILSLILVLAMILSFALIFTSCSGSGSESESGDEALTVEAVKENAPAAILSATEKTTANFYSDDKALADILNTPLSDINGAEVYFNGESLGLPAFTLTAVGAEGKSSAELLLSMGGKNYTANIYQNSTGIALFGPSLLGVQDALLINPENFIEDFFASDLAKMLGISEDVFESAEMGSVASILKDLLPKLDFAGIIEKIQKCVAPKVSTADNNGTPCILVTYTIDNATLKNVIDIIATELSEKLTDYADMINQTASDLKTQLDSAAAITVNLDFAINTADSSIAYVSLNGEVTVDGEKVEFDLTTTYTENEIKSVATVTADGETATATGTVTQKIEDGKSTYTLTGSSTMNGETETFTAATFEYTADTNAYVFTVEIPEEGSAVVKGTLLNTDSEITFAVNSFKMGPHTVDLNAGIKLLKNASVEEMPEGAKDITEITEAEWAEIMGEFTQSPLFAIIGQFIPKEQ